MVIKIVLQEKGEEDMDRNTRITLMPQYMKNFQCIGASCEDSCCMGWKVIIDNSTYKKYQSLKDLELSPLLKKSITRNRSNSSKENYAKIKMKEDNSCPFLNAEKLCSIQLKRGPEYLSNVCAAYPRIMNKVDASTEISGTISCPEIARLALLNPNLMEFDECYEDINIREKLVVNNFDTKNDQLANMPGKYFWEIRIFTISILQNRKIELWERMIVLGLFYNKLQDYIDNCKVDLIPDLILYYSDFDYQEIIKESLDSIKANENIQINILANLAEKKFLGGVSGERYIECFQAFINGLHFTENSTVEEIAQNYSKAYFNYYQPFMRNHEYILENYLVNYVFKEMFPFNGYKSIFDSYMMLVIHYSLIKMHLIGMSAFHKGLNIDLVIELIQSLGKNTEHNKAYLLDIQSYMVENKYNSLAYMAILIKN